MKNNIIITLFSFSIFIFFIFCAQKTFAQQVILTVSPPLVEALIKPGKDILIGYKIQNLGDPTIVTTRITTFYPHGNNGNILIKKELEGPVRFNLENTDIQLGDAFFLKNNAEQQILLKMRVPENAPQGDYYYTLLFESKPQSELTGNSSSGAKATIGANLLLTISTDGQIDINGKINQFAVLPQYKFKLFDNTLNVFDSGNQIPIILNIQNQGKNLIKPNGTISINGSLGEKTEYTILPENILSESQRIVHATPSANLNCEGCSLVVPGFFMGKYTLDTKVNFGEGTKEIVDSVVIYYVPLKLSIAIILCSIIGFILFKRYQKIED
jgi:hypothetical protein